MKNFKDDSRIGLDLVGLNAVLPILNADKNTEKANWLGNECCPDEEGLICSDIDRITAGPVPLTTADTSTSVQDKESNYVLNSNYRTVEYCLPRLVMGGGKDFIVDTEGVQETAKFLGVKEIILSECSHDMMLETNWMIAANQLEIWLKSVENLYEERNKRKKENEKKDKVMKKGSSNIITDKTIVERNNSAINVDTDNSGGAWWNLWNLGGILSKKDQGNSSLSFTNSSINSTAYSVVSS